MKPASHPVPPARRTVAIVGRPNVGKSAIFNRLIGRRLAIVHEESGVTRDRLVSEATWDGQGFEVIDTGGLARPEQARADSEIAAATRQQVAVAVEDAAVILLVVDITAGVTPLDEGVAQLLRRSNRPVRVAANKADHPARDDLSVEFTALGWPVFPVSALHDRGFDALMEDVLRALPPAADLADQPRLKVAVVGRPNCGKSSFINRLLGRERVIVSAVPGTTRDSIEIPFSLGEGPSAGHYLLIDTAGMRKVGKVHDAVERFSIFRAEKSIRHADVAVLVLDAEQGPTEQDKHIAARVVEEHKGCVLLVNKWDLVRGRANQEEYARALQRELAFLSYAPLLFVSALTGYNIRRSLELINQVAAQVRTRLPTGVLNRTLRDAFERTQPPMVQGRRMKLYYATQAGTQPVRLQLFVNDPKLCPPAYQAYLVHALRDAFGLEGAPVVLRFRSSHQDAQEK